MLQFQLPTRPALTCAILSLAILPGCTTMTSSAVPTDKVACNVFAPVYWSKSDTDKTIAQVKEHNAAGKSICGWKAAPKLPASSDKPKLSAKSDITFKDRWYEGVKVAAWAFR